MEEGNLRCDANISLRLSGTEALGTRVEIKNLNSFKNVQKALEYEIERQMQVLNSGGEVVQETRLFDADRGVTESMRSKEEAHDYRYFPEPDLLPLEISSNFLQRIKESVPELPQQKRKRFQTQYGLSHSDSIVLTEERSLADYFEEAAKLSGNARLTANWILRDLLKNLKDSNLSIDQSKISPEQLAKLISLIANGTISGTQGKEVFEKMWATGKDASEIVAEAGMKQISGEDELNKFVDEVISGNPEIVQRYRGGELKLLGVLVGEVMKSSKGKANPAMVNQILKNKLG
jgi:aspartyl-tRNA(Asn)/glutamyl-tRNA(Gln) amidotransferase subunit B